LRAVIWVEIELGVLGPLEVSMRGDVMPINGLGARLLLALAVDRGRAVEDDELVERLWVNRPPSSAIASVRNQVGRLRRSVSPCLIVRDRRGYRLGDGHRLDVDRFADEVDRARAAADPAAAAGLVDGALALVRGRPFDEVADELWAMPAMQFAVDQIASAEELWAAMAAAVDPAGVDPSRLRRAASDQPHREVRWLQLVDALAAMGRRTEALRAAGDARRALAEYGLAPGDALVALERQLVGADAAVNVRRVPARRDPIVGRDQHVADVVRPGRVVWVDGAQGVGKTRLLAEAADRFDAADAIVVYAACPRAPGQGEGVLAAIASAAGDLVAHPPHESSPQGPGALVNTDSWPAQLAERIVRWLGVAASEREVAVLVDDVQWLDPAAVAAVFDAVVRTAADVHWVLASRPVDAHAAAVVLRGDLDRVGVLRHVTLGPLTPADLVELAETLRPELDDDERAALALDVMAATHGHALDAAELIAARDGGPGRLASIVTGALGCLAPDARWLVELLTVAGGAVPIAVLAGVLGRSPMDVLELAEQLVAEGLLAPVVGTTLDLRQEMVRRALEGELPAALVAQRRHELVRQLVGDERDVVMLADQLLRGRDVLEPGLVARLDDAVADAIDRLLVEVEYAAAADMAVRYLDVAGSGPCGLSARLKAATALLATGDVARGRSVLTRLLQQARDCGDDRGLADAILAVGPLSTGRREQEEVLDDAEALLARLPSSDGARRVQLACWVAHHVLLTGDRMRAMHLLDMASADPYGMAPSGQGLILALRAQADTLVGPGPGAACRSLAELRRFADAYADPIADAAERLLAVREAWAMGTLADVDRVRRRILEMADRMPRPDLRWWPLALEAAIELAAGRLEPAREAVEVASRTGRELGVATAAPTAMAQYLLLQLVDGTVGAAAESLGQLAGDGAHSTQLLAAYGMACVEAGDVDTAAEVADRLAAHGQQLLVSVGASWPQVAMCASVVAAATGQEALAASLWRPLERFRGTGLSLHSVGYFGCADRYLGLLAVTLGDRDRGVSLLADAVAAERRRGSVLWERLAAADLEAVTLTNLRS
jgi:DNA-binding SARP family transcriptional activator